MENKHINIVKEFLTEQECINIIQTYKDGDVLDDTFVYDKITNILSENFKFKGHHLSKLGPLKFKKYTIESKYTLKWKIKNSTYFRIVVQLNDNFENGYQQFLLDEDEKYFQVPKITGSIVFFYSNMKHRISPVESNVKYVLESDVKLIEDLNFKKTLL